MLFNSIEFLLFLPAVFILYWFVFNRSLKAQNALVLVASYFFYGWWSWKFALLLILSTTLDYLYGFFVASANRRKAKLFLWLSIINNLGILAVFKYYDFFAQQFAEGLALFGLHTDPVLLQVALPIGISFYTFHGLSYVFDIYNGRQQPVRDFIDYAVFVAFFPLLVAGPIERANHLLPQVQQRRTFHYTQAVEGCRLILWGMFKKVLIADSLADYVNSAFGNYHAFNGASLIVAAISFSFQVYGDFSGYSDIAIGTAKLFGFELLSNFKFPFFSRNMAELWRRWHISLFSWFRDYLYFPLGGSRKGKVVLVRNIFIVFLLSGLWHGAQWHFIAWGFLQAWGVLPYSLSSRKEPYNDIVAIGRSLPNIKELLQMVATFSFFTISLVIFRADSVTHGIDYLRHIVSSIAGDPAQLLLSFKGKNNFIAIGALVLIDWYLRRDERKLRVPRSRILRWIIYAMMIFLMGMYMRTESKDFFYFQF